MDDLPRYATDQIENAIVAAGGSVRDALNTALARIDALIADRDRFAVEVASLKATFPPDAVGLLRRLADYISCDQAEDYWGTAEEAFDDMDAARAWADRLEKAGPGG